MDTLYETVTTDTTVPSKTSSESGPKSVGYKYVCSGTRDSRVRETWVIRDVDESFYPEDNPVNKGILVDISRRGSSLGGNWRTEVTCMGPGESFERELVP